MIRIGLGFDSHRLIAGRELLLGGVRIDHDKGLLAHSDGDVVLHALTDAILGAIAAGDIGEHFPDTNPEWKDADSRIFLLHARDLAFRAGYRLGNCDVTIIAEEPKLSPHKSSIVACIAEILQIEPDRISIKAKTAEGVGIVGGGEAIACIANIVLLAADQNP
jgi:2-C-methyl-D-erythritol 4-phosphate cytidylyltransferase/2-C-methyl-D-erythritol 2,4-cyclodiphosphate synthase